jgi:hypothetical protein
VVLGGAPPTGKAWFGILGPLTAGAGGGQRLELRGRNQRELLALLLINANRHVPAGRIADALWRGEPPAGALSPCVPMFRIFGTSWPALVRTRPWLPGKPYSARLGRRRRKDSDMGLGCDLLQRSSDVGGSA